MRKQMGFKQILFSSVVSLALFPMQAWSIAQLEPGASTALGKLNKAQVTCADAGKCAQCKSTLSSTQKSTTAAVKAAVAEDAKNVAAGTAGAGAAGASTPSTANGYLGNGSLGNMLGGGGAAGRSGAAGKAAAAFQKCADDLKNCQSEAQQAIAACQEGAAGAGAAAADQGKAAGDMAGLGDALSKAAGMLGPLMQAMQGKDEPPKSSGIDPPKNPVEKPQQIAGTSLANNNKEAAKGITIGNTDPGKNEVDGGGAPAGAGNMAGFSSTPNIDSSLGGESSEGGPSIASVAPSAAGGASGTNSSGASMMGDLPVAAAGEAAKMGTDGFGEYSLVGGGGGSRPSFLGLKSKPEGEGTGEEGAGENPINALVEDEGERSLASEDPGINTDPGGNLFSVIHTKYKEIKLKGNI